MRYGCILLFLFYRFCLLFFSYSLITDRGEVSFPRANISHDVFARVRYNFVSFFCLCLFFVHLSLQSLTSLVHFTIRSCIFRYNQFYIVEENSVAAYSLPFYSFSWTILPWYLINWDHIERSTSPNLNGRKCRRYFTANYMERGNSLR